MILNRVSALNKVYKCVSVIQVSLFSCQLAGADNIETNNMRCLCNQIMTITLNLQLFFVIHLRAN